MTAHIDATGWWIAASLVEEGRDPEWVLMVMREKGHGEIDLDKARAWLASGETECRCECKRNRMTQAQAAKAQPIVAPVRQLTLF